MEIKIKPSNKNKYSKGGILIKNKSPKFWLQEIEKLGLNLTNTKVYAIPSAIPNELYGCYLIFDESIRIKEIGRNNFCQIVEKKLIIPEYSDFSPTVTNAELQVLFPNNPFIIHPDFGLYELSEKVNFNQIISIPKSEIANIEAPLNSIFIPNQLQSFRVESDAEQALKTLENPFDESRAIEKLPFNMEKVLKGNQKEIDKYLAFLEKNPEMALKFAIPLDIAGSSRGGFADSIVANNILEKLLKALLMLSCLFILIKIIAKIIPISYSGFIIFLIIIVFVSIFPLLINESNHSRKSSKSSGKSKLIDNDRFNKLREKYNNLAELYVSQNQHHKAANIYLKLLKDKYKAAQVLEQGKYFGEAAAIYLKHCDDKAKAADCYENGKMYSQSIEIYKELGQKEKVGDLYLLDNNKPEADKYFKIVADDYIENSQYVKASLIYKKKIKDSQKTQDLLIKGWRNNNDAYNCLNNYFANINQLSNVKKAISGIYKHEVFPENKETFLQVIKQEFAKNDQLKELTKKIAYEIISERISSNPQIASELMFFNKEDKQISKDVLKYRLYLK
jgi:hypothetical protein